jgi:hypothetical protein
LTSASSAFFSSPLAWATFLPKAFCSARRFSKRISAARRAESAEMIASTTDSSAPRARWLARNFSGFSLRSFTSITT